tara:strand:+ start:2347 stop:2688 length:342 start_codon:yes stop_codon:yes gene_type:complete
MNIDFDNKESRQGYLSEKLDNLLSGINNTYGQVLLDELVIRLQRTVDDFKEEMQEIMGELKNSSERRNQIIHDLMEGKTTVSDGNSAVGQIEEEASEHEAPQMSEWEKRLEGK